jgi:hypothetical protein
VTISELQAKIKKLRKDRDRMQRRDRVRKADLHVIGHFHMFRDLWHTIVNGSMVGYSAFALSIGADPEEPAQAYWLWDSKHGKTAVSPLWVRK